MTAGTFNFSPRVEVALRAGGRVTGRKASELVAIWERDFFAKSGFTLFPAARRLLLELGGVTVQQDGPGMDIARGDFFFDPTEAFEEEERFGEFSQALGSRLCPLGMSNSRDTFLALAEDGRLLSLMDDAWIIGQSVEEGLESLVVGRRGIPIYLD